MASWSAPIALTGFRYSAVDKSIVFTSKPGSYFWSNGYAWGTCKVEGKKANLTVLSGRLELSKFTLANLGSVKVKDAMLSEGKNNSMTFEIR